MSNVAIIAEAALKPKQLELVRQGLLAAKVDLEEFVIVYAVRSKQLAVGGPTTRTYRRPTTEELVAARSYLFDTLWDVDARIGVLLGAGAATCVRGREVAVTRILGEVIEAAHPHKDPLCKSILVIPSLHPVAFAAGPGTSEFYSFVKHLKTASDVLHDGN